MKQTTSSLDESLSNSTSQNNCNGSLTALDAFLYGLPGGLLLSGLLLLCFIMFGNAITGQNTHRTQPSASSNTRIKRDPLGKKNKRGPPPSMELRRVDVNQMALHEDAPDDIKAVALASKVAKAHKSNVI